MVRHDLAVDFREMVGVRLVGVPLLGVALLAGLGADVMGLVLLAGRGRWCGDEERDGCGEDDVKSARTFHSSSSFLTTRSYRPAPSPETYRRGRGRVYSARGVRGAVPW